MNQFRDYVRAEWDESCGPQPVPTEKLTHILRSTGGLRTLCGLGKKHRVWRVSLKGAEHNVNGDGWAVCAACVKRAPEPSGSAEEDSMSNDTGDRARIVGGLMNRIRAHTVKLTRADGTTIELAAEIFRPEGKLLGDEVSHRGATFRLIAHETDAVRYEELPAPGAACGKPLECGATCWRSIRHDGPCLCSADEDGVPGTCPA